MGQSFFGCFASISCSAGTMDQRLSVPAGRVERGIHYLHSVQPVLGVVAADHDAGVVEFSKLRCCGRGNAPVEGELEVAERLLGEEVLGDPGLAGGFRCFEFSPLASAVLTRRQLHGKQDSSMFLHSTFTPLSGIFVAEWRKLLISMHLYSPP